MRQREQIINAPTHDVRSQLLELGMNSQTATMAIPYVWFLPSTSDPYSPVIIMLVEGIQYRLRTMGIRTRQDGFIDARTNTALARIAGANWKQMPWVNVIGFLLHSKRDASGKENAMSGFGSLGDYDQAGYYGSLGLVPTMPWVPTERGSCQPTTPTYLASFMYLQAQLNRALKAAGKALVKVDGIIGKKTVAAVNSILGSSYKDCGAVSKKADSIASSLKVRADSAGVPAKVTPPRSTKEPVITTDPTSGKEVVSYKSASLLPFDVADPMTLAAIGIGGLLIWSAYKQRPKKKAPAKRKRASRGRRLPRRRITRTYY